MGALLDMSLFPLPAAVEELDYEVLRLAWMSDYAARMNLSVADLNDNDPAVKVLETGAYRELLVRQRINDAVRRTFLASAYGKGLDDQGADPLYGLSRLVLHPGDPGATPPVPPTYEDDAAYRARLAQAPNALSVAGPAGAYRTLALAAHPGVVDVAVSSPAPSEVLVEVLFDASKDSNASLLDDVRIALSLQERRPVGDLVTVTAAQTEPTQFVLCAFVDEGPDLEVVRIASEKRLNAIVQPLAARVRSGLVLSRGGSRLWLGAAMVPGVVDVQRVSTSGATSSSTAWWPMTINVEVRRFNAAS